MRTFVLMMAVCSFLASCSTTKTSTTTPNCEPPYVYDWNAPPRDIQELVADAEDFAKERMPIDDSGTRAVLSTKKIAEVFDKIEDDWSLLTLSGNEVARLPVHADSPSLYMMLKSPEGSPRGKYWEVILHMNSPPEFFRINTWQW